MTTNSFIFKKLGTKYVCFGPGMKRYPGEHKTPSQAMRALVSHREAYNLENLPGLSKSLKSEDTSVGPSKEVLEASLVSSSEEEQQQQQVVSPPVEPSAPTPAAKDKAKTLHMPTHRRGSKKQTQKPKQ